jgi:hypothetical protein
MSLYLWTAHDQTLASCWEFARDIQSQVHELETRASLNKRDYQSSAQRDVSAEHRELIFAAESLVQRTWDLYDWARDEGKTRRPAHPWDTEPASQSEYARALGIEEGKPVSPMRGVVQLHKELTDMFEELMRL